MSENNFISSIWNFDTSENSNYITHGAFRWYGKLVPQLVSKVLDLYAVKNDNIIANFCGSGTIALESMVRGINCITTDINDLSLLIADVKTTYINIKDLENKTRKIVEEAKIIEDKVSIDSLYQPEKWYKSKNAQKLVALKTIIEKTDDISVKNFYMAALMNIVRECSNIDSRCVNHIVVNKNNQEKDVYYSFISSVKSIYESIQEIKAYKNNKKNIKIMKHSADDLSYADDNSIDLVFSHPPYLNAVNYYNIYRLCTDLLNANYDDLRKNDFSAKKLDLFLNCMFESFQESYRVLKNNKRCVVVIGDTRYQGNLLTLQVEFVNLLKKAGFVIEDMFIWELNKKAGMNVARRGNFIDHNYVIVAKKEG